MKSPLAVLGLAISLGLLLPLGLYARRLSQRPPKTTLQTQLFQGIAYERQYHTAPYPHLIHLLTIDLKTPGLKPFVTPGVTDAQDEKADTQAQTTSEFLHAYQLQLAVNAGFFNRFSEKTPWDFYPHSGDPTNVLGEFISEGDRYSIHPVPWPTLCFRTDQTAVIVVKKSCPPDTNHAVSGNAILYPIPAAEKHRQRALKADKHYPRTIAALNADGTKLWLILVDGKQPHYSEGFLLSEAEHLLAELGATLGINLDGGGSVTLVQAQNQQAKVLNAPIHAKWPMAERPIATHLGFYAPPIP